MPRRVLDAWGAWQMSACCLVIVPLATASTWVDKEPCPRGLWNIAGHGSCVLARSFEAVMWGRGQRLLGKQPSNKPTAVKFQTYEHSKLSDCLIPAG